MCKLQGARMDVFERGGVCEVHGAHMGVPTRETDQLTIPLIALPTSGCGLLLDNPSACLPGKL